MRVACRGVAEAALSGQVPTRAQALVASDMDLIERLTCLRGIGRWTVEMFLLENLQRPDVLPADDFGVRQGYRRLKGLEAAPGAAQLRRIGQAWQPYRSAAAWCRRSEQVKWRPCLFCPDPESPCLHV